METQEGGQIGPAGPLKRRRIVLFPMPLQGHITPMLQLASILHSKGFGITIIHTTFNAPNPSNYPEFGFLPLSGGLSLDGPSPGLSAVIDLMVSCIEPFRDCLGRLLSGKAEEAVEGRICCLITDGLWHVTQGIADSFGLPRIVLRTSSMTCFLVYAMLSGFQHKGYLDPSVQGSRAEEAVPEFPLLRLKDIPIITTQATDQILELITDMVRETKLASGIVWNTFQELEMPIMPRLFQEFPVPHFPLGPFHKYFPASSSSLLPQDGAAITWLDSQPPNSVIYVSFGSIVTIGEAEFAEMALALANSGCPFLWVVRPGSVLGSGWLGPFPDGLSDKLALLGRFVKWAPQHQVLAHKATGAFWTHCGWNSVLESICEGVPMICSPFLVDQPINARHVSGGLGIGVLLEKRLQREEIESAIKRVMVDGEGERMRERVVRLRDEVNLSLKQGGPCCDSLDNLVDHILSL